MDNSSATVMLGLEGMAVLAVSERDGELEYAIQTTASTGWCPVRGGGQVAWSAPDMGAGSAGDVDVGQTDLALHLPRVRAADLDRKPSADQGAGIVE